MMRFNRAQSNTESNSTIMWCCRVAQLYFRISIKGQKRICKDASTKDQTSTTRWCLRLIRHASTVKYHRIWFRGLLCGLVEVFWGQGPTFHKLRTVGKTTQRKALRSVETMLFSINEFYKNHSSFYSTPPFFTASIFQWYHLVVS